MRCINMTYQNQKTYPYWIFYEIDKDRRYSVYAYTDSKELSKLFEKQRDMSIFIKEKKHFTSDDLYILHENCPGCLLTKRDGETYIDNKRKNIELVLTESEHIDLMVMTQRIQSILATSSFDNPFLFKDKYAKALSVIKYIASYLNNTKSMDINIDKKVTDFLDDDFDIINIFIYLYGKYTRKDEPIAYI